MDMKHWTQQLRDERVKKALPVLSFPGSALLGCTVRDIIGDARLQARCMKAVADRTDGAAAVSLMDLSVEAEAFGSQVRFSDNEVPTVTGAIAPDPDSADALAVPEVGAGRTGLYIEAASLASDLITDRPVLAGVIGPFSLAGRLMGVSEALMNCYVEPEMVKVILEKATAFVTEYVKAYKAAGLHGVVMAEPLTGLLSPALVPEFSEPYVRRIVDAVQDDGFIVVYHNCGNNTALMTDSILRTGAAAFHFGNSVSMTDICALMPQDVPVLGNIDPAAQFCNGTPESIRSATLGLMGELCPKYPNFVISSGCDIPPQSPWANIDAFFAAVREYYAG